VPEGQGGEGGEGGEGGVLAFAVIIHLSRVQNPACLIIHELGVLLLTKEKFNK